MVRTSKILLSLLIGALAVLGLTVPSQASTNTVTPDVSRSKGPVGWDVYRQLGDLPLLSAGADTRQFSSFDRTGGNTDWWQGPNDCLRLIGTQCVIAENSGAGEVDEIWFTWNSGDVSSVGNITITLDGRQVVHAPLQDIVNGKLGAPFSYPLVGNADQSSGGTYIAVPMPYDSSMVITTDSSSFYYHVTYRTFADSAGVRTFDPTDKATDVLATLRAAGTRDPKPALPGATTTTTPVSLASGASETVASTSGPGELTGLRVHLPQAPFVTPTSVTATGRAFGKNGSSTFTMKINPHNNGVVLTRRLDPGIASQVATVAVNGDIVGRWAPNPLDGLNQWYEESVSIPGNITSGKTQLSITNSFVSSTVDFNEFTYWAYSVVNGKNTLTDQLQVGDVSGDPTSEFTHSYSIAGQTWQGVRTYVYPLNAGQQAQMATARSLLQGLRLRISFDGKTMVDSPLGEFYGTGFAVEPVDSLFFGVDPGTGWYSSWWPMPYASGATVGIYNASGIAVSGAQAEVTSAPDAQVAAKLAMGQYGYFQTNSHAGPTTPGQDWSYLQTTGTGKFVGDTVDMLGPGSREYLEGDEHVYTDVSKTPQLDGTGTEDFYQSGWYFNRGPYNTPTHGNSAHLVDGTGCATGSDCTTAFRLMLADSVPYGSNITFGIEHGETDNIAANYSSTAYYYGQATPSVRQSDLLTVGDAASEAAHQYTSTDPGAVTSLTETYEGNDGTPAPVTMSTRATNSAVTFTMALDPTNDGAVLLRTSDQAKGYQSVAVTVNGQQLADWVQPLANPFHQWLDDSYQLPAALTEGHSSVTVTLTPTSGAPPWSAAAYRLLAQGQFTPDAQ
ncbi:MAG TPA: glycoside hydrolase family 172 protein [Pseudonocardiaceae bacterium]|nr:glycoside hydrolase family 172 protein [Pseudonocardiaceae bacterium]